MLKVQPHDELWDSLDGCLCKTKENTCQPCAITTTPDIFIPNGKYFLFMYIK